MKDFRETIRVLRLRLHGLEVLLAAEGEGRTEGWFLGGGVADGERGEATGTESTKSNFRSCERRGRHGPSLALRHPSS